MQERSPSLRRATEADVRELALLWTEAFPGSRTVDDRVREMNEGMAYGTLADCRILEVDGRAAAALRAYRMELHFGGERYPAMGLAGVAVAPDFRRRGLGKRICVEALREARQRGDALSLLYPFRVSFYRSLGWTLAGELHHHRFRPADLPLHPGWDRVERGDEADLPEMRAFYRRVAERSNGMLERGRDAWRARIPGRSRVYLYRGDDGRVGGYLIARPIPRRDGALLRVSEMLWEDEAAYLGLLGWISAQRDQYPLATHDALPSERFHHQLPHPKMPGTGQPRPLWLETARLLRGPMLRVLDPGALQAPGGDAVLAVADHEIPESRGRWQGGDRLSDDPGPGALTPEAASAAFLLGALPGQHRAPDDWTPAAGVADFRLLDEF